MLISLQRLCSGTPQGEDWLLKKFNIQKIRDIQSVSLTTTTENKSLQASWGWLLDMKTNKA
jgi:hypothetical protein